MNSDVMQMASSEVGCGLRANWEITGAYLCGPPCGFSMCYGLHSEREEPKSEGSYRLIQSLSSPG